MNGLLIKNPIVDLPIKMKENLKRTLCNSLGGGGGRGGRGGEVQDKDMGAASQITNRA